MIYNNEICSHCNHIVIIWKFMVHQQKKKGVFSSFNELIWGNMFCWEWTCLQYINQPVLTVKSLFQLKFIDFMVKLIGFSRQIKTMIELTISNLNSKLRRRNWSISLIDFISRSYFWPLLFTLCIHCSISFVYFVSFSIDTRSSK